MMENFITKDLLNELGFLFVENEGQSIDGQYGKAIDLITGGMTQLAWNTEGASCTYFGQPLPPNIYFSVKKDGGTRTAFMGYVFDQDDVRRIIHLTM